MPQSLVSGLVSALHIRLSHPTKGQLKKLWNRYFFALNSDSLIDACTNSCTLCNSLKTLPRELFYHSTSNIPSAIGKAFSADIIRRERQKIFILMDIFSSFVVAQLIPNEQHATLQQALIQLSANYKHTDGCIIRVDNAPGFVSLRNDQLLQSVGITLDFGRVKNKNKNPHIDRAIQQVEGEIKRLVPRGGPISAGTLAIAIGHANDRIRNTGLSAKEVLMKRDSVTDTPLIFDDAQLQDFRYERRLKNHPHSEKCKARGALPASNAAVERGDIVHVKEEGTKHIARDFYLVVDVDYGSSTAVIQKFCGNKLQCKRYSLNLSKIYPAASDLIRSTSVVKRNVGNRDDYDDVDDGENDISIFDPEGNSPTVSEDDLDEPLTTSLRRTNRIQKRPDWLATSEIERV